MTNQVEAVQRLTAEVIARSPAGVGLCLVGGYRYRLLNSSVRWSADLNYHFDGDLEPKRDELLRQLRDVLCPRIKQHFGWPAEVWAASGPEADSPFVKSLEVVAFSPEGRVTVPVDLLKIPRLDKPVARTVAGTVYLSTSDADLIESKILAVLLRTFVEARDLVDVFLFQSNLVPDAPDRVTRKLTALSVSRVDLGQKLQALEQGRQHLTSQIELVLSQQVEASTAQTLQAHGGGAAVFDGCLQVLRRCLATWLEDRL